MGKATRSLVIGMGMAFVMGHGYWHGVRSSWVCVLWVADYGRGRAWGMGRP